MKPTSLDMPIHLRCFRTSSLSLYQTQYSTLTHRKQRCHIRSINKFNVYSRPFYLLVNMRIDTISTLLLTEPYRDGRQECVVECGAAEGLRGNEE